MVIEARQSKDCEKADVIRVIDKGGNENWWPKKNPFFVIFSLFHVWNSVNILACLPAGKLKTPVGGQ